MAQRTVESVSASTWRVMRSCAECDKLALAGGVASNVKANRRIRLLDEVDDVFVFPHMGDGGLAAGRGARLRAIRGERLALDFSRLDLGPSVRRMATMEPAVLPRRVCALSRSARRLPATSPT